VDLTPIIQSIAKTENVAILVLLIVCAFLCRVIIIIRKEDRADRAEQELRSNALLTRNNAILDKIAEAIVEMRITLATRGIRDGRD
jgi:DNA gyrase/topoisomerase IV subunit A